MLHPLRSLAFTLGPFLLALPLQAQWSDDPANNLVLSDKPNSQTQPKAVATDSSGSYVSWFDNDAGGSPAFGYDVYLQRLDAAGTPQWADDGILIADRGFSSTQNYGLGVDTAGNALLAFRDDRPATVEITATKIDSLGNAVWGASGIQLTSGGTFVAAPQIVGTTDGGSIVAWTNGSGVRLRKLDAAGSAVWASDVSLTPGVGTYSLSDLQASDAGGAIFAFVAENGFGSPRHLLAQKVSGSGALLWGAGHVAVFDGGSLQFGNFPSFLSDGSGGAVFGFYTTSPALDCRAQRIDAAGNELFPHNGVTVSTDTTRVRVGPRFAFDAAEGATYLVYPEQNNTQSQDGVSAQKFDASGNRLWGAEGLTLLPLSSDDVTRTAAIETGNGLLAFWSIEPSFAQAVIEGIRIDDVGPTVGSVFAVSSTPSEISRPRAIKSSGGFAILTWAGGNDIYAQNVTPKGGLGNAPSVGVRNGNGSNSLCFNSLTDPVIGQVWDSAVDTTGHPGATFSVTLGYTSPAIGPTIGAGELLIDLASGFLYSLTVSPTGGNDVHSIPIPNDIAAVGFVAHVQAVIFGGGAELCNALEVCVGL